MIWISNEGRTIDIKDRLLALFLSIVLLLVLIAASPIGASFISGKEMEIKATAQEITVNGTLVSHSPKETIYQVGDRLVIAEPGQYRISGDLGDIRIFVEPNDSSDCFFDFKEPVELILADVKIIADSSPALTINTDTVITLADGSSNQVVSTKDSAIESNGTITMQTEKNGFGELSIDGEKHGISCGSDLKILSGSYTISGRQCSLSIGEDLSIRGGDIIAYGDEIKSSGFNAEQTSILLNFESEKASGSTIQIDGSDGKETLKFQPAYRFKSFLYSSGELERDELYKIYCGNIQQQHFVNTAEEESAIPQDLEDWLNSSDIPADIGTWIKNMAYGEASSVFIPEITGGIFDHVRASDHISGIDQEWPFTDVSPKKWYYEGVRYSFEKGLLTGVSETSFAPGKKLNRAMLVTALYRMEGSPASTKGNDFSDVKKEKWYADAIKWAAQNDIVKGYNENRFGPKDAVTREQLASILYRYADYKKFDISINTNINISKFKDYNQVSGYAREPLNWAYGKEFISGRSNNKLAPDAEATRAEASVLLMRFMQNEGL